MIRSTFLLILLLFPYQARSNNPPRGKEEKYVLEPFVRTIIDTADSSDNLKQLRHTLGTLALINKAFSREIKGWVNPEEDTSRAEYLLRIASTKVSFKKSRSDQPYTKNDSTLYLAAAYLGNPYSLSIIKKNFLNSGFFLSEQLRYLDQWERSYTTIYYEHGDPHYEETKRYSQPRTEVLAKFPPPSQKFLSTFLLTQTDFIVYPRAKTQPLEQLTAP
jgi:hypothetical protein